MADYDTEAAVNLETVEAEAVTLDAATGLVPTTSTVPRTALGFGRPLSIRILSGWKRDAGVAATTCVFKSASLSLRPDMRAVRTRAVQSPLNSSRLSTSRMRGFSSAVPEPGGCSDVATGPAGLMSAADSSRAGVQAATPCPRSKSQQALTSMRLPRSEKRQCRRLLLPRPSSRA